MNGTKDDDQDDWKPAGKTLDADGRVSGTGGDEPFATRPPHPAPARRATEAPLELEARAPKQPDPGFDPNPLYRDIVPTRPRPVVPGWLWALALVLLAGGAALIFWPALEQQLPTATRGTPILQVQSTPEGATVKIDGRTIGETPLFLENLYGGEVSITLTRRGYEPWTGTFEGGEARQLEVELKKKRAP